MKDQSNYLDPNDPRAAQFYARQAKRRSYRRRSKFLRLGTLAEGTCKAEEWIDGLAPAPNGIGVSGLAVAVDCNRTRSERD